MNHYSIVIEWDDQDQIFVVSFPEWSDLLHTHGATREEALKNAQELLDLVIESRNAHGEPLPQPRPFVT